MRILFITYKVDESDSLVGFVVGWLNALAAHASRVEVICLASGPAQLHPNVRVHSLGTQAGAGKPAQALAFYRVALGLKVDVVFCQFSPEFVMAIAPLAKLRRWPVALWYTHRHAGLALRIATRLADRVLTASPESFRLRTPKLRVIGHGISTTRFAPSAAPALPGARRLVLAVGRIAPVKNYELLIAAAQRVTAVHADVDFVVAGGAHAPGMQAYLGQLQALAAASALGSRFQLIGPLPYAAVPGLYQSAAVAANLCGTGGMDKAVLEGFSCGLPTVVRNTTFAGLLAEDAPALLAADATADDVALLLLGVLQQPAAARQALGARLRSRVVAGYGEQALAEKLFASLKELCA